MDREEALKQIQEINQVIESSHRFLLSGLLAILYGVAVLLIPLIEWGTKELTFGNNFGEHHMIIKSLIHVAFYATLFLGLKWLVEKFKPNEIPTPAHPILVHALAFHRPIAVACCGTIIVFGSLNLEPLIPAYIFIFFGILFNYYGRLSHSFVRNLSWTYIYAGLILAFCSRYNIPNLWMWFSTYLGVSFIVLGLYVNRENARRP